MPSLPGKTARLLGLDEKALARWSVRWRALFPHDGLREHQRVPLYHPDVPFILITSQKAGSTLGVAWFFQHAGLLSEAKAHHEFVHRYEQEVFLMRPGYMADLERAIRERPVLKLVRDPADRAFSSYMALQGIDALSPGDHRHGIRRRIAKSQGLAGPEAQMPFAAFLAWVAGEDHRRLDGHEARQFNLYEKELPQGAPQLIRLEETAEALPAIEERFGLPRTPKSALEALGASGHYVPKAADPEGFRRVLYEGIALPRRGKAPALDRKVLAEDAAVIAHFFKAYGEDYERYGYKPPA
ncbi:hypothetical protein [Parvularcula lutaonensis]|uniref:Sulfotransferase family protein n=1 Tax=Parvularcula lutaonensis TaxID=491923 RepID=A0ABV7MAZ2_9PROT|nr:hypothetical protein [Parvularcula lutaonensis]GGY36109.1 hypothetical protein GCM10007148_00270 [Parvularcula lutaonensis]